ncbi:phosphoribosyltransferase [Pigmentiphaga aceris]|uniref:Orotate phosphoribosyltransferase n=1 Tax=Pigmentiphaga aceris TaxID=1940612 RepID=A0A5C0B0M4_9BURK|nr:phosphoribosyltransferase [Pigmentiphaga aceris]QEI07434.1 phosphoribosyltransferase [Pigmentiphaga aceris]
MTLSASPSEQVASTLVRLGAVRISSGQPFIYTSGWASPVYIDTRLLMSDVAARRVVLDVATAALADHVRSQGINAVVGAESSGIAFAAWLAERLNLPMLYLRKRPLGWGNAARLEGLLPPDAKLLYVDDVTTDARSKVAATAALRATGAQMHDCLVFVDYAIYPGARALLAEHKLGLHSLAHWAELHAALIEAGGLSDEQIQTLAAFSADPVQWSIEHGGVGA